MLKKSTSPRGRQKGHLLLCSVSQLVKWAVAFPLNRMARGTAGNQSQFESTVCLMFSLHTVSLFQVSLLQDICYSIYHFFSFQG